MYTVPCRLAIACEPFIADAAGGVTGAVAARCRHASLDPPGSWQVESPFDLRPKRTGAETTDRFDRWDV